MLAVNGIYQDGQVTLKGRFPVKSAEVIVVFPDQEDTDGQIDLSAERKQELFDEFSGSVDRIITIPPFKMSNILL